MGYIIGGCVVAALLLVGVVLTRALQSTADPVEPASDALVGAGPWSCAFPTAGSAR